MGLACDHCQSMFGKVCSQRFEAAQRRSYYSLRYQGHARLQRQRQGSVCRGTSLQSGSSAAVQDVCAAPDSINGVLSVYAVSDLHCDYPANQAWVRGLPSYTQQHQQHGPDEYLGKYGFGVQQSAGSPFCYVTTLGAVRLPALYQRLNSSMDRPMC